MCSSWSRRDALKVFGATSALAAGGIATAGPSYAAGPEPETGPWARAAQIRARITPPGFPARSFDVTDYGAVPDGTALCTEAFRQAIVACNAAGGGHVVVPAGTFLTGAIHLLSDVDLHLEDGATITFSQDPADYLPVVYTRWQGIELMNYSPFIYAFGQRNIAITGAGTLNGQADATHWWPWSGLNAGDWTALQAMADAGVPVQQRIFGAGHHLRPNFIQPYQCRNVLIEDFTITGSPMWQIHPVLSQNITVRNVAIPGHGPNTDGCDPESCHDVLITGCTFDDGDDCIAIKSGRAADGRRINVPSENVVIEDCDFRNTYGAIAIGSEMTGGARNIFARNCTMGGSSLHYGLYIKADSAMGGFAEDIHLRDLTVTELNHEVISINLSHSGTVNGPYPPTVQRIGVRNLHSQQSRNAYSIIGYAADYVSDVTLDNCTFDNVAQPSTASYVDGFTLRDVTVNGQPVTS